MGEGKGCLGSFLEMTMWAGLLILLIGFASFLDPGDGTRSFLDTTKSSRNDTTANTSIDNTGVSIENNPVIIVNVNGRDIGNWAPGEFEPLHGVSDRLEVVSCDGLNNGEDPYSQADRTRIWRAEDGQCYRVPDNWESLDQYKKYSWTQWLRKRITGLIPGN